MFETMRRGRAAVSPETAAERRRLWREQVDASGMIVEQIAQVVRTAVFTVRSYGTPDGLVPPVAAINALARRNAAMAEMETIQIGFFDE